MFENKCTLQLKSSKLLLCLKYCFIYRLASLLKIINVLYLETAFSNRCNSLGKTFRISYTLASISVCKARLLDCIMLQSATCLFRPNLVNRYLLANVNTLMHILRWLFYSSLNHAHLRDIQRLKLKLPLGTSCQIIRNCLDSHSLLIFWYINACMLLEILSEDDEVVTLGWSKNCLKLFGPRCSSNEYRSCFAKTAVVIKMASLW